MWRVKSPNIVQIVVFKIELKLCNGHRQPYKNVVFYASVHPQLFVQPNILFVQNVSFRTTKDVSCPIWYIADIDNIMCTKRNIMDRQNDWLSVIKIAYVQNNWLYVRNDLYNQLFFCTEFSLRTANHFVLQDYSIKFKKKERMKCCILSISFRATIMLSTFNGRITLLLSLIMNPAVEKSRASKIFWVCFFLKYLF